MPPRNTARRTKKRIKKRNYKMTIKRTPKLKQRILGFKRNFTLPVIALENSATWPAGFVRGGNATLGNSVVGTLTFSLNQLPGYSEFKNLFQMYKLNHVVMKIYTTTSQVVSQNINGPVQAGSIGASNFTVETWMNPTGQPLAADAVTDALINQIPAIKRRIMPKGKPYTISCPLKQLSQTYREGQQVVEVLDTSNTVRDVLIPWNVDYAVRKPRYLNTSEDGTPHYGVNIRFKKLDDSAFDTLSPRLKIMYTLYFSCKGIQ